jgi:hypothetical protein
MKGLLKKSFVVKSKSLNHKGSQSKKQSNTKANNLIILLFRHPHLINSGLHIKRIANWFIFVIE